MIRRTSLALLAALLLWPTVALAAPDVPQLVEDAIKSLRSLSYTGNLRFLTKPSGSDESMMQIKHLAPDLYHVTPVVQGVPIKTYYYVENAEELVKIYGKIIQPLPERQYAVTDALTAKFLRDLGRHPGTALLDGVYMGVPVYILRQDSTPDKPYLITVGLRQDNSFPIFLQVVDAQGRTRVHTQYDSLRFVGAADLPDELFTIPETSADARTRAPRAQQAQGFKLPPAAAPHHIGPERQSAIAADLPLYPQWLPEHYTLEAISALDYTEGKAPAIVYQFEIYGPRLEDVLSVFQMQCNDLGDCNLGAALTPAQSGGYVLQKHGDWVVAVFGNLPDKQLRKIIERLDGSRSSDVLRLLEQTSERDRMLDQLAGSH